VGARAGNNGKLSARVGQILQVIAGKLIVNPYDRPGCWIEVARASDRPVSSLCKLELDRLSPLTPRTNGFEQLRPKNNPPDLVLKIEDGVWWCSVQGHPEQYLVVKGDTLLIVTKAQAYCGIGAVELLQDMGLEDAAIALSAGQFDLASVQVIAERERRAAKS
jgi:hypothetical protein